MSMVEEVRTRKLQPIYNALESGNWRQAAATPTDEDTLAAMSYNYRMMNRRENVAPMFEAAVKAKPSDASLLKELFMCYVRAKDYLKAQQAATKLYKVDTSVKGGKFIIWAAATMLLQAQRKDASAGPMTLPLAEKMTLKVLIEQAASGSRPVGEELLVYIDILKLQGKHREAIEALERFEPTRTSSTQGKQEDGDGAPEGGQETVGAIEDESSLEGGTIVHMQGVDRLELKAGLLCEDLGSPEDLERADEIVRDLLQRCPDQWSYYSSFLDLLEKRCVVPKEAPKEDGSDQEWPNEVIAAFKTFRRLQEDNPMLRGPFIAEMELMKRAIGWFGRDSTVPSECLAPTAPAPAAVGADNEQRENGVGGRSSSAEAVVGEGLLWGLLCRYIARYMTMFSTKLCCFRDMRPYLALFAADPASSGMLEGLPWLRDFFRREAAESKVEGEQRETAEDAPLDPEQREMGVKRLHRYICACQSRHFLGDYTDSSEASATPPNGSAGEAEAEADESTGLEKGYRDVVQELTVQYRATLHLNLGSDGGCREVQHGDELVILAARTMLRLSALFDEECSGSETKGYLARVEAACLLEGAISCSPYNPHLKILAMDVYRRLGSFARGLALFGELDVKQIQMDSLSYLMLEPSACHGLFGEIQGQCRGIVAVHRNCRNETADHVARAFDRGNYSKGSEVDRFQRETLDRSLQLAIAKAGKVSMDVILDHQTFASAARYLQEQALLADETGGGGGTSFPGDTWLDGLKENMDYFVQEDRCLPVSAAETASLKEQRRQHLNISLKRLLLGNQILMLALKGDSGPDVDAKAKELEKIVQPEKPLPDMEDGDSNALEEIMLSLSNMCITSPEESPEVVGWRMVASAARALAFAHQGLGSGNGGSGKGDQAMLRRASGCIVAGTLWAKTCKGMLAEFPRHVCVLEKGGSGGNVYQAEAPLRPQWLRFVSKMLAHGMVYTSILLQAIGAELPLGKKKKGGKGKGKGKGKKSASGGSGSVSGTSGVDGGGAEAAEASSSLPHAHEELAKFGWQVSEVLRAMSVALKSEMSAKTEPASSGETLSKLLKGELGSRYEPAIGILWEEGGARWCKDDVVSRVTVGITGGQALCCQRLLSVVTENLSMLQRWDKK